ncbi:TerD family protein [uncultured Rhodospira sp.]|mgnify:CR=1 FL=1|uniref:TerD family protein n=1 Tax=uncultured Rhodospira sp. TaxID=1936189 RepID=UPI0026098751|nr:TerD family protein [uncultured Rhodospira sp.]
MSAVALVPGANTAIPGDGTIGVAIGWAPAAPAGMEIDASAFMIGADGTVLSDEHFVFYGAAQGPGGTVRFLPTLSTGVPGDIQGFEIDLPAVPPTVQSIDICLTIHEGQTRGQKFSSLSGVVARVMAAGTEVARFDLSTGGMSETAITLMKVYRRNDAWKVRAVGQGFAGGLAPLARQYGVDIAEDEAASAPPQPAPPPPAPEPAPSSVNLSKVTLEKRGQSVSLDKKAGAAGYGEIIFNLNWNEQPQQQSAQPSRGLFGGLGNLGGGRNRGIDLDLGCLWDLRDGDKGAVQALGESWGRYDGPPFIRHAGDDRTGALAQGETIRINGDRITAISRILVYAFIYEGAPNWAAADGIATVRVPGQPDIEVRLDNPRSGFGMCAIALIENIGGTLRVTKEERYFRGHRDMDEAYGWGLRWTAGSKD